MARRKEMPSLANAAIILVRPKYPENIGAAARIAHNMGISRLIVVADQPPDLERMIKMATHNARHLVEPLEIHETLAAALAPFSYVVATTARDGRRRRTIKTPRTMPPLVLPQLAANKVALLFGPEDRGLENDDLKFANLLVTIPSAQYSSLNLAQAVGILCYELHMALMERQDGQSSLEAALPRQAGTAEMEGMYAHIEQALSIIEFFKKEDHAYWMGKVRAFLGRLGLRAGEVRIIRGLCRQWLWYEKTRGQ